MKDLQTLYYFNILCEEHISGKIIEMETFLLNAIAEENEYDKDIIEKGNRFVDEIDPERRYLNKRRYITKAKFDVYFSVRTSAEQFNERQGILKNVAWEDYTRIQHDFRKLADL